MKTASQVLRDAKRLIDEPGKWCKSFRSSGDAMCAHGAIQCAISGNADNSSCERERAAALYIIRTLPRAAVEKYHIKTGVANWNNAPERTHADVMAAFDRAIALAEKDEGATIPVRESAESYYRRVMGEIAKVTVAA